MAHPDVPFWRIAPGFATVIPRWLYGAPPTGTLGRCPHVDMSAHSGTAGARRRTTRAFAMSVTGARQDVVMADPQLSARLTSKLGREHFRLTFDEDAAAYDASRPVQPAEVFDDLVKLARLRPGDHHAGARRRAKTGRHKGQLGVLVLLPSPRGSTADAGQAIARSPHGFVWRCNASPARRSKPSRSRSRTGRDLVRGGAVQCGWGRVGGRSSVVTFCRAIPGRHGCGFRRV